MMIDEKPVPGVGLRRVIRANVMTVVFEVVVPKDVADQARGAIQRMVEL